MTSDLDAVQDAIAAVGLSKHFEATAKGLVITGDPTFGECESLWETLLTFAKTFQFLIGDAMTFFRKRWGDKAEQIISERTGWSLETLRAYEWTAEKVSPDVRRLDVLSYSHHQAAAKLNPREQKQWLAKAANGDGDGKVWSVKRLTTAIHIGADPAITAWYLLVKMQTEDARTDLMRELEGRGYLCKATEKRGGAT